MTNDVTSIIDQAIAWHLRQDAMAEADWPQFVAWLEADPAHADAYDRVAASDRRIADVVFPAERVAANDDGPVAGSPPARRPWRLVGGGIAAAAVAALLVPLALPRTPVAQVFATRDGERRDVRLPDGTTIAMNGGTTVRVAADDPRRLTLEGGQVMLSVVHDAAHPFTIQAGGQVIRDLGTRFDVTHDGGDVSVAVAEGSVMFQPASRSGTGAVRLGAGDALRFAGNTGRIERSAVATAAVGGWRTGMLSFNGQPLAEVAASLRRLHGTVVTLAGDLPHRPFTGMIHVTGTADRDIPHLADLIGATWRREGKGWVLAERTAAP